jgi:site-specific DNA-methyltransferase (adenine-specific)
MEAMKEFPDKYFELAIVDPPYGIGEHGQRMNNSELWKNPKPIKYKKIDWDNQPPSKDYFKELCRVSKNQIIWGANHFIENIPNSNSSCWIVWDKKTSGDFADCELAWSSFLTSVRLFEWLWSGFRKQKPEDRIHPTQKPVALYKWLLTNYAKQGDKILDTHLGSGSSRIAAYDMGFDFWGYELDTEYFEAQEKRFNNFKMQGKLFL